MLEGRQDPLICCFVLPEQGKRQSFEQISMPKLVELAFKNVRGAGKCGKGRGDGNTEAGEARPFAWEQVGTQSCVLGAPSSYCRTGKR